MTKPDLMAELAALLPADWEAQACGGHLLEITNFLRAHHAEIAEAVRDTIPTSAWEALLPGTYYMDPPDGGDVSVYEQMRRMAKDAARYRWLRDEANYAKRHDPAVMSYPMELTGSDLLHGETLDAAIDTAMRAGEKP
jgi:hypothetical protein